MIVNLVNKYGVIPKKCFPESFSSRRSLHMNALIKTKVRQNSQTQLARLAPVPKPPEWRSVRARFTRSHTHCSEIIFLIVYQTDVLIFINTSSSCGFDPFDMQPMSLPNFIIRKFLLKKQSYKAKFLFIIFNYYARYLTAKLQDRLQRFKINLLRLDLPNEE